MSRLAVLRYPVLALLAALVLWPGINGIPPFDRDESRYAQATAQMLESGNFVDVRFQDAPRYLQPAGIYWLQAAAVSLLGGADERAIWMNRVPGALAAVAAVLLTCRIASVLYGPEAGLIAGALMALSVLLGVEARMAKIDATLLAVVLTAQAALLEVWRRRDTGPPVRAAPWVFWAANGVGLMLKGPVILLVTLGTLLGLFIAERRIRWMATLRPWRGLALMVAIVLPWLVGIVWISGTAFFTDAVGHNFLGKLASGQQAHGAPPGTYLALFVLTFWPGSLYAPRALARVWARLGALETRFLLAWILPTWIVFEAVATKLPHYVLPTYPAIAALIAAALAMPRAPLGRFRRRLGEAWGGLWLAISCALALAGPILLGWFEHTASPPAILATVIALPLLVLGWHTWRHERPLRALGWIGAGALVVNLSAFTVVLPGLTTIWLSPRIAAAVAADKPCPTSQLASASYSEPSLVYLVGRNTRLIGPAATADFLHDDPACGLALVDARDQPAFAARAAELGLTPRKLDEIDGINYSNGRRLKLTLYAASPSG